MYLNFGKSDNPTMRLHNISRNKNCKALCSNILKAQGDDRTEDVGVCYALKKKIIHIHTILFERAEIGWCFFNYNKT